jgi:hypothetical protein
MWNQFSGWQQQGDCSVNAATSFIMPAKDCLSINYFIKNNYPKPSILVKRDLALLKLSDSQVVDGELAQQDNVQIVQKFCSENSSLNKFSLYTIGWVSPDRISHDKLPIRLNWLRVN